MEMIILTNTNATKRLFCELACFIRKAPFNCVADVDRSRIPPKHRYHVFQIHHEQPVIPFEIHRNSALAHTISMTRRR